MLGVNLPPESGLAGGGGRVLAADIWCIRKRVVRPSQLLAGALGLGSGDTEYQLATPALLRLDLPSPVLLKRTSTFLSGAGHTVHSRSRQLCARAPLRCG